MAFTGSATFVQVTDNLVRCTGLSLANGASGTLSFQGGTGDFKWPAQMSGSAYAGPGGAVTLQDAIEIWQNPITNIAVNPSIRIVKTGTTQTDFLATFTNDSAAGSATMEIYIRFH